MSEIVKDPLFFFKKELFKIGFPDVTIMYVTKIGLSLLNRFDHFFKLTLAGNVADLQSISESLGRDSHPVVTLFVQRIFQAALMG